MKTMSLVVTFRVPDDCTPADLHEYVRWMLIHDETAPKTEDVYDPSAINLEEVHTPVVNQP